MLDYRDELEEIRKGLDYQYYFDEAPGLNKMEVPASFAFLDKKFERLQDLPLSEKVETGKKLLAQMIGKAIDHKLTLAQKVYPKLQELTMFYYEKWMVPVVFPLRKKEKEEIERLKASIEARKKGTKPGKSEKEILHELHKHEDEHFQEEKERRQRFIKFYDLLYNKKDLIKEVKDSIKEKNLLFSWWIYKRTNELLEAVAQHKKDENSDIDKAHIVDLLGFTTMAKSLYWNVKFIEEKLENIRVELFGISDDLFLWPTKDFIKSCKKEGKQAIADINSCLEDKYFKYIHTEFNFYHYALMIWDAEQMLARELKTVEPIASLPDKIREKLQKWANEARRKAVDKNKLQPVKVLAEHYNLSGSAVYKWKGNGAPFHGNKASINELDQWLKKQSEKASQSAKNRTKKNRKRTSKK